MTGPTASQDSLPLFMVVHPINLKCPNLSPLAVHAKMSTPQGYHGPNIKVSDW